MKIKRILIVLFILAVLCSCAKNKDGSSEVFKGFSESDLPNATIGLYAGTPMHSEILSKYPNAKLEFLNSTADMLLHLQQNKSDCFVIGLSEYMSITGNNTGLTYCESSFEPVRYGAVFSEKKLDVREQFNEFIAQCKKDGTLEALKQEWVLGPEDERSIDCTYTGENGVLKIATEASHAPMTYIKDNQVVGYEFDLVCQFCEKYGYIPQIDNCGWDPMNAGIKTGKYDIGCCNIMYWEERAKESFFSDIYYEDIVVLGYINPNFIDLSTLSGQKIGIVSGSVFDTAVKNCKEIVNPELLFFSSDIDVFNSVINGKIAAGATDYPLVHYAELNDMGIKVASDSLLDQHTGFIFKDGFPLANEINEVLKKFKEDGTIQAIMNKWYNMDENTTTIAQDWPGLNGTLKCVAVLGTAPITFSGDNGNVFGYDPDILLHIARELDYKVEMALYDFTTVLSMVSTGKADIGIGSIAWTEERAKSFNFSEDVYTSQIVLYTKSQSAKAERAGLFQTIKDNFEKTFIRENRWKMFLNGFLTTLAVSVIAVVAGTLLGFAIYMACRTGNKIVNKIADLYLWFINGIPVVVLLMILFYIVLGKTSLNGIWVSSIGFILIFASGMLGMLQTGVGAIDNGQNEAGLALGYSPNQTFFKIILPQAAVIFMPSYKNQVVQIIKATAVVGYIAVQDLTKVSDLVRSRTFAPFFPLIVTAVFYFVMAWFMTIGVDWIIRKITPTEDRAKRAEYLKGVEL